jgi:hypothetical protein
MDTDGRTVASSSKQLRSLPDDYPASGDLSNYQRDFTKKETAKRVSLTFIVSNNTLGYIIFEF